MARAMSTLLSLTSHPPKPLKIPNSEPLIALNPNSLSRRLLLFTTSFSLNSFLFLSLQYPLPKSSAETPQPPPSSNSFLSGIANTKSWLQFYGDGFAIRVPPQFEDITEPEDFNAGLSLYGDKAKPKTFAARFASPDGSEVVSVVIRPTNQLKITFLEAQDISDLGSLKQAARIFVPGGATLYSARTIKIKEDEGFRTYYFYEFGRDEQHVALVASVNSGKAFIAGATAPQDKWNDDGIKLRSAAVSLTVL
nr:Oxygen-evolving enhancer protein like [Ipomoea batatas]